MGIKEMMVSTVLQEISVTTKLPKANQIHNQVKPKINLTKKDITSLE